MILGLHTMENGTNGINIGPNMEEDNMHLAREETTGLGHHSATCALSTISENAGNRMLSSATPAEGTVTIRGSAQVRWEDRDRGGITRDSVSIQGDRKVNHEEIVTHRRDSNNLAAQSFLHKRDHTRWIKRNRRLNKTNARREI